jgi:hypothetical protein
MYLRWGPATQNEPLTYKRKISQIGLKQEETNSLELRNNDNLINQLTNNTVIKKENNFHISTNVDEPGKSINIVQNINNSDNNNRRYSSAPVASKDEQAELIRKQKAKLERHFRRSTQV